MAILLTAKAWKSTSRPTEFKIIVICASMQCPWLIIFDRHLTYDIQSMFMLYNPTDTFPGQAAVQSV